MSSHARSVWAGNCSYMRTGALTAANSQPVADDGAVPPTAPPIPDGDAALRRARDAGPRGVSGAAACCRVPRQSSSREPTNFFSTAPGASALSVSIIFAGVPCRLKSSARVAATRFAGKTLVLCRVGKIAAYVRRPEQGPEAPRQRLDMAGARLRSARAARLRRTCVVEEARPRQAPETWLWGSAREVVAEPCVSRRWCAVREPRQDEAGIRL